MSAEMISGLAFWKYAASGAASIAAFFGVKWVNWVSKRLNQAVTREELQEHLDRIVDTIKAETEKNKSETEKLFLQLQVESLQERFNNKAQN